MMMQRDRKAGLRTSGLFLAFWILMSAYGSFKLRTYILVVLDVSETCFTAFFQNVCLLRMEWMMYSVWLHFVSSI